MGKEPTVFKQLFSALKGSSTLDEAFDEFGQMLDHAAWMFGQANDVLNRVATADDARDGLYNRDKSVNQLLRSIRRKVVRHLTINPGIDVGASLALLSIASDAERIGDYCKNVFEVARFYRDDFGVARYHEPLEKIREEVTGLFVTVRKAFDDSDASLAKDAIDQIGEIRSRCDLIIEQLLLDESGVQTHEAVAYSLLARHYKRVAAHISNICSALRGNVEELGFHRG